MSDIFICHSAADKGRIVNRLANQLRSERHQVWYDDWSIPAGGRITKEIDIGIARCDVFMVVFSTNSIKSAWVKEELNAARFREIEENRTLIIPVLVGGLRNSQIPTFLRGRRYVDFRRASARSAKFEKGIALIRSALRPTTNVGVGPWPVFSCPRLLVKELEGRRFAEMDELGLICLENTIWKAWRYVAPVNRAELYFQLDGDPDPLAPRVASESQPIVFELDELDRDQIDPTDVESLGWFVYRSLQESQDHVLKLQYKSRGKEFVSLYRLDHAIRNFVLTESHIFANDWDLYVMGGSHVSETRPWPIFSCPRLSPKELKGRRFIDPDELSIVCLKNGIERTWRYLAFANRAELYLRLGGVESRPITFELDESDRDQIDPTDVKAISWFVCQSASEIDDHVLGIHFISKGKKFASHYRINYAVKDFMLAQGNLLANDWDVTTLGVKCP